MENNWQKRLIRKVQNKRKLHIYVITLIIFATFSNTLPNRFNIDDSNILLDNPSVHGLSFKNIKEIFTSIPNAVEYLPIRDLTYMIDYEIWGLNPFGYHLSNLLFYLASCLMLYLLIARLLERWYEYAPAIAFFSTVAFSVHPVHVESVAGIAMRKDLVSGLLFFLSLFNFLLYKDEGKRLFYIFSLITFALSLLSKSTAVILPVIILLLNFVYLKKDSKRILETVLFFIVALLFATINVIVAAKTGLIISSENISARLPIAFIAVFYYAKLLLFPYPLTVWHEFNFPRGMLEPMAVLSLAGLLTMIYIIYKLRHRNKLVSFSGAWYLSSLIPVVGLLPTSTLIAERYLFLPSISFSMILAWLMHSALNSRKKGAGLVILVFPLVIALSISVSFQRNFQWKNTEALLSADLEKNPASYKLTRMLGRYYFQNGQYDNAFVLLRKAKEINVNDRDYEFYLALSLYNKSKYIDALNVLDGASFGGMDIVDAHYLYGRIYEAMGDYRRARGSYLMALESKRIMGIFFKNDVKAAFVNLDMKIR